MIQIRELLDIRGYKLQGAAPFDDLNFYVRPKGWGMHMHSHEHMQFLVVLEGALYVSIEKRVYLLTAGAVIWCRPEPATGSGQRAATLRSGQIFICETALT